MTLNALFANPTVLPTVPKVVQELIRSFSRDDVAVEQIASRLEADPVLSAKTLRLANSAYFHVSRRIGTVNDALLMLGFVMVRNLVVGCGLAGTFKDAPGIDLPQFWRYSLDTACTARWLAHAGGHNADLAFTVGLVHGLGQLLMHAAQPAEMGPLDRQCHPLAAERAALEQAELGYHHGDVGAELALRWKFPEAVTEPLKTVPDPLRGDPPDTMAALIHLSAWRARVAALHIAPELALQTCPTPVGALIGLPVVWLPEPGTWGGDHPSLRVPMPPLGELSRGLDAMLH